MIEERRKTKTYKVLYCEVLAEKTIRAFSGGDAHQKGKLYFDKEDVIPQAKLNKPRKKIVVVSKVEQGIPGDK